MNIDNITVLKRDGRRKNFSIERIYDAISKAYKEIYSELTEEQLDDVYDISRNVYIEIRNLNTTEIDVETIQDIVVKNIKIFNGVVAKAYQKYRDERSEERERKFYSFYKENVIDKISEENSNANVDENNFGGKEMRISDDILEHNTDILIKEKLGEKIYNDTKTCIKIHDKSKFTLGQHNCIEENGWIKFKNKNGIKLIQLKQLKNLFNLEEGITDVTQEKTFVLSRDGWTRLNAISMRKTYNGEEIYIFKTRNGLPLKTTGEHNIPILRNGKEIVVKAKEVLKGDILLSTREMLVDIEENSGMFVNLLDFDDEELDLRVQNVKRINDYLKYKYNTNLYNIFVKNGNMTCIPTSLKIKNLKDVLRIYPIPFDVFFDLRVSAHGSKNSFPILIPYSTQLAKLYGYVYADGGVYINKNTSSYQVTFTNTNLDLINDYIDCFEDVFDIRLSIIKPSGTSPCYRATCGSKLLVKLFKSYDNGSFDGSGSISVPDFILNGSEEIKLAFLSSILDCDGSFSEGQIKYFSSSETFATQVFMMIKGLGYNPTIYIHNKKGSEYTFKDIKGQRNFDNWCINLSKSSEVYSFSNQLETFKEYTYENKTFIKNYIEDAVVNINKQCYDTYVYDLETDNHYFIVNDYIVHNCLLMPYKDMIFKNGINTRQGDTKPTKTYNTACHLVPVAIQSQSLDMFGGCGLMNFSIYMVESLKWSITYFTNLVISISNYPIEEIKTPLRFKEAKQILNEELFDKMMTLMRKDTENANQALITNLITLQSRSGHQLPFSSINLGLIDPDNEEESAYIVEMFLKEIDKGVGKRDRTAVFPITIFQVKGGVNRYPQDKYYYLRMLAQEVSHRRLYPTFVNCDFSHNVVTGWESEMNMMGKQLLLM